MQRCTTVSTQHCFQERKTDRVLDDSMRRQTLGGRRVALKGGETRPSSSPHHLLSQDALCTLSASTAISNFESICVRIQALFPTVKTSNTSFERMASLITLKARNKNTWQWQGRHHHRHTSVATHSPRPPLARTPLEKTTTENPNKTLFALFRYFILQPTNTPHTAFVKRYSKASVKIWPRIHRLDVRACISSSVWYRHWLPQLWRVCCMTVSQHQCLVIFDSMFCSWLLITSGRRWGPTMFPTSSHRGSTGSRQRTALCSSRGLSARSPGVRHRAILSCLGVDLKIRLRTIGLRYLFIFSIFVLHILVWV